VLTKLAEKVVNEGGGKSGGYPVEIIVWFKIAD
jgi:hypothetical protein